MEQDPDQLYQSFDKNLYRLTGSEMEDSIFASLNADPSANNASQVSVSGSDISSGVSTDTSVAASGSTQAGKKTFDNTIPGYILGFDPKDGYAKFYIGNTTNYLNWDGATLTIVGGLTASSGSIGGFAIGSDYVRDAANSMGLASTVTGGDDVRFWAGATFANRATAPFRVTESGLITATNVVMTGTMNATAGYIGSGTALIYESQGINTGTTGYIRGGQTDYDTGTGYFLGYSGGAYKFSIGDSMGNRVTWDNKRLRIRDSFHKYTAYLINPADLPNTNAAGKWEEESGPSVSYYFDSFIVSGTDMDGGIGWGSTSSIWPISSLTLTTTKLIIVETSVMFQGAGTTGVVGAGFGYASSIFSNYASDPTTNAAKTQNAGFFLVSGALTARTSSTAGNNTDTTIASPPTLTNLNTYRIEYDRGNSTPQVRFYVNEVLKATHTTNLPTTGNMEFGFAADNSGGTPLTLLSGTAPVFEIEK